MTFPIPDVALNGRIAIVGISGSGKSTTAKGGVERVLGNGMRVCVVDLLDGWWGLRVGRDGHKPAFKIPIFGGRHGDLPLTETSGALIGQSVAQSSESTIVSLSELDSDAARRRFALAFFDSLHKHNKSPLHLVVDEADFYCPQTSVKDGPGPMLLNRIKEIAARGRMRGFRCWLITQRPAKLNKDALSQADTLIAMQLTSSQDRSAIEDWIGDQADKKTGAAILASLPRLEQGHGVLWSPRLGILETTAFPMPDTYDSSRTPEYGDQIDDVVLGPIDVPGLRDRLAKVEADAARNDPRALKAEIAALKKQIATVDESAHKRAIVEAHDEGYEQGRKMGWQGAVAQFGRKAGEARASIGRAIENLKDADLDLYGVIIPEMPVPEGEIPFPEPDRPVKTEPFYSKPILETLDRLAGKASKPRQLPSQGKPVTANGGVFGGPAQRILDGLKELETLGVNEAPRELVAFMAGYSNLRSKGFTNALGTLRTHSCVGYGDGTVKLTDEGNSCAHHPTKPLTTGEMQARIVNLLGGPSERILDAVIDVHPDAMSREMVAALAGYDNVRSKGFTNALGRLHALGFVEYRPTRGEVRASDLLFP